MKKAIGDRIYNFLKKVAVRILLSKAMKNRVISDLNKKIDIPILDEAQEREFFEIVWDTIDEAVRDVVGIKEE